MKRSLFYVAIAALQSMGSIGAPLLAARMLEPSELGVLAVGVLVIVLVRALASFGLYGSISVSLHEGPSGVERALRIVRWSGETCLPAAGALIFIGFIIDGYIAAYTFAVSAGFAAAAALGQQSLHRSIVNHPAYAATVLGPTAVANLAGLIVVLTIGGSAREYLGAFAVVSLGVLSYLHLRHLHGVDRPSWSELRPAMLVGMPLVVTAGATVGLSLGDRPFIQSILGSSAAGRYHLLYILAAAGIPLLGALNNAWLPSILNLSAPARMPALSRSIAGVVGGMFLIAIGSSLAAPVVVNGVGGPGYTTTDTATLSALVALGVVPYAVYSGMSIGLLSLERTLDIGSAAVVGLVLCLIGNALLIPAIGLAGAATASVVGYSGAALVCWRRLSRLGIGFAELKSPQRLIGWVAIAGVLGATAILPFEGNPGTALRLLLGASAGSVGCIIVARATSSPG